MIKNFLKVEPPKVELGNLGLNNACSFYVPKDPKNYPIAMFAMRQEDGRASKVLCNWDNPGECPQGYLVYEQLDSPLEALLDYAKEIKLEHIDMTDARINHDPSFNGRKRSARWQDERRRRGLIQ